MKCLTIGCNCVVHCSKNHRSDSWGKYQICSCCAYNLNALNPNESMFRFYTRLSPRGCTKSKSFNKFTKPTKQIILELSKEEPRTTIQIYQAILKQYGQIAYSVVQSHISELKRTNNLSTINQIHYPLIEGCIKC